jgi:hypothetical protein
MIDEEVAQDTCEDDSAGMVMGEVRQPVSVSYPTIFFFFDFSDAPLTIVVYTPL